MHIQIKFMFFWLNVTKLSEYFNALENVLKV